MSSIKILKTDNFNTKRAKKSFNNKVKRKDRNFDPDRVKSKSNSSSAPIYNKDIEQFLKVNKRVLNKKLGREIYLDNDFCLLNNPSKVLLTLVCLLNYSKSRYQRSKLIYRNFVSFGAVYLLDSICWQIAEKKQWQLNWQNIPEEERFLLYNLKSNESSSKESKYSYMVNSRIPINREDKILARQVHEQKSKEIRDLVERGIKEKLGKDYKLSQQEHTTIHSAISEHFDNILLHVPTALFGHLCGIYNKNKNEVRILIYNFGITIAESMQKEEIPFKVKGEIEAVIKIHTEKKNFITNSKFTKDNAITLLALQEGISSKLSEDPSRGHGLIDFAEHCLELNPNSSIRIISGRTAIKIDGKYKIEEKEFLNRKRRIIALNEENDIYQKPDEQYVINMGVFFPGTIIETVIPLTS
jgi:hypothetical protein